MWKIRVAVGLGDSLSRDVDEMQKPKELRIEFRHSEEMGGFGSDLIVGRSKWFI